MARQHETAGQMARVVYCDIEFIKSQVEKRRRERMNHSLECLRTMLLQEPQQLTPLTHIDVFMQGGTQHRVEKAEILEHTVLFLQNTAKTRAGGGQKHSFQDGFSTCLHTAAQFLGPEGKGLGLGAVLDASLATRFSHSDSEYATVQNRTEAHSSSSSLPHTKSILHVLRQKSKHRQHNPDFSVAHPYLLPVQQGVPRIPQQAQRLNKLEIRPVSKQSQSQSSPVSQTLWRPWP
ncbi:uncharacterized protein LOC144518891 [Sander vitreus]